MNQTWENGEKPNFGLDFGSFGPNLELQNFSRGFYPYQMLDIVVSYHCMQFQGKLMIQTQENGKKPNFGPNLSPLNRNSSRQFFFRKNLASSVTRYHGQLSSCTISQKTNEKFQKKIWCCYFQSTSPQGDDKWNSNWRKSIISVVTKDHVVTLRERIMKNKYSCSGPLAFKSGSCTVRFS